MSEAKPFAYVVRTVLTVPESKGCVLAAGCEAFVGTMSECEERAEHFNAAVEAERRKAAADALREAAEMEVVWQGFEHEADCSNVRSCIGCQADSAFRSQLRHRADAVERGEA